MRKSRGGKELESRYVFRGKRVSVKVTTFALPSGKVTIREIVEHRGAVAILPILKENKIVMLKQYRPAIGRWIYEIPAGTLEPGENPRECAERELEEETGYKAGKILKLFEMYLAPGYSTEKLHSFVAFDLNPGTYHPDLGEEIEVIEVSLEKAIQMIDLNEVMDAKTIATILYFVNSNRFKWREKLK